MSSLTDILHKYDTTLKNEIRKNYNASGVRASGNAVKESNFTTEIKETKETHERN